MTSSRLRYDHFALLCETLPVGIPSLAFNLLTIAYGRFDIQIVKSASKAMQCGDGVEFIYDSKAIVTRGCDFPGSKIYELVSHLFFEVRMMTDSCTYF